MSFLRCSNGMQNNARALFIDPNQARSRDFAQGLTSSGFFFEEDTVTSPTEALQRLLEERYQVIFLADEISRDQLGLFVRDASRLENLRGCLLFLLVDLPGPVENEVATLLGCTGAIGRRWAYTEPDVLREALAPLDKRLKEWDLVKKRFIDVHDAVHILIREIDNVARDRKRGANANFNTIAPDFLEMLSDMSGDLQDRYFNELSEATKDVEPEGFNRIDVSQIILSKELPRLTKDNYSGVSRRVWSMLVKKFGVEGESEG